MIPHALKAALLGCALVIGGIGVGISVAVAQEPPPPDAEPRCGGLLCDIGVFGGPHDRTTLPCDDFFCRAFGGGRSAAPPPPAPVAATEPEPAKPAKKSRHKRVSRAKTDTETK